MQLHASYLPKTKIIEKIYACNLVRKLELAFLTYFEKNSMKFACFCDFFSQKSIFVLHYDVIVKSYTDKWYLFWYHCKEETHSCTLAANIRVYDEYRKSRGVVGGRVTKTLSGGRGLTLFIILSYIRIIT